eukprot:scaffold129800_cov35-Tisochrysis_lutea.AAC.3
MPSPVLFRCTELDSGATHRGDACFFNVIFPPCCLFLKAHGALCVIICILASSGCDRVGRPLYASPVAWRARQRLRPRCAHSAIRLHRAACHSYEIDALRKYRHAPWAKPFSYLRLASVDC